MEGRSTLARTLRRLAASGLLLGVLLAALEWLARVAAPTVHTSDALIADAELGFRNVQTRVTCRDERGAFEFVTNSLGCRGPELPAAGSPRETGARVLLVGDSFLHAWNVRAEDWVGTVLRESLAAAGRPAEVYALSGQDYGTAQELLALREHGARVRPDTVVLFLYPGNDLINNTLALAGKSRISPGDWFRPYLVPDGAGGFERTYAMPARARLRCSRAFQLLERRWLAGRDPLVLRQQLSGERFLDSLERIATGLVPEQHLELFREPAPGDGWDTAWRATEALVLGVRDEARRLGAELVVVVIPHLVQVEHAVVTESYDAQLRAAGRAPLDETLDFDLPERRLEAFFHREGLAHVQLLGELRREVGRTRASLFQHDGHLTGAGHAFMGRLLAARLAPGAADVCLAGAGSPVDVPALAGELLLELDLRRHEHVSFFGWGWQRWIPPAADPKFAGWAFDARGTFLARAGRVTLSGVLKPAASYPATLSVSLVRDSMAVQQRKTFAAAGPFSLAFELAPDAGAPGPWIPLNLRLEGAPSRSEDAPPRVLVQRLALEPLPASDANVAPVRRSVLERVLRSRWLRALLALETAAACDLLR